MICDSKCDIDQDQKRRHNEALRNERNPTGANPHVDQHLQRGPSEAAPAEKCDCRTNAYPARNAEYMVCPVKQRREDAKLHEQDDATDEKYAETTPRTKFAFDVSIEFRLV